MKRRADPGGMGIMCKDEGYHKGISRWVGDSVNLSPRNFPPAAVRETVSEGPELGAAEVMLDEEDFWVPARLTARDPKADSCP